MVLHSIIATKATTPTTNGDDDDDNTGDGNHGDDDVFFFENVAPTHKSYDAIHTQELEPKNKKKVIGKSKKRRELVNEVIFM